MDEKQYPIYCSPCGKGQDEVKHIIHWGLGAICNECVYLCRQILIEEKRKLKAETK